MKHQMVKKICEFCSDPFSVTWKYRGARFCSRNCMYEWRKTENWESAICKTCGGEFKRRIADRNWRTGKKRMYCSNDCNRRSEPRREKMRQLSAGGGNPFCRPSVVKKIKQTKLKRYGTSSYNNQEKSQGTMMKRYGVHSPFCLPSARSNGHRISSVQRRVFEEVQKEHKDAILEHYLPDVKLSVDIFIPKTKQVIEVFGDYWHMNPKVYKKQDFNTNTKLSAGETWMRDSKRVKRLQTAGYGVSVVWENALGTKGASWFYHKV